LGRVEDFLKMYSSANTVRAYRWALVEFFKTVYGEDESRVEELAERYFSEKRDYEVDIQNFLVAIRGRPPKSVKLMIAAVRTFLVENGVELPQKFWRRLRGRIKGNRALTLDKVPSNLELRKIIMHMPIQGKAFFLTLAGSGMRIGEALKLKLDDVDLNVEPARVSVRGEYTKTGNPRVTFISREAKEAIQEWLKVRSEYLEAASARSHLYGKSVEDPRLFPFESTTAYSMWRNALKKAGYKTRDKSTNRHQIHPHVLRKFFRTRLGSVIPVDVVEALMGHEGYLTEVYRRYSMEELAKFYKEGEHALLIFTEAAEVASLKAEIEERNRQLQALVNSLAAENLELKSKVARLELENVDLKRRIQAAEDRIEEVKKRVEEWLHRGTGGSEPTQ